jgi:5-methylcytosine-specific restriction protein A
MGRYHGLASDIFECHHTVPLASVLGSRRTRLEDLAVLCPTCHRATHRIVPEIDVPTLRQRLQSA